jgi:PPOX class probable F420-dependent enzyme
MPAAITPSAHVDRRLREEPIIWLSTVRPDGRPHLVPVWFLWDGSSLLIFSKLDQKIRNLRANPRAMLSLNAEDDGEDIVILEGTAELSEGDVAPTLPAYAEKYARLMPLINSSPEVMAAQYNQVIRITPIRLLAWGGEG